MTTMEKVIFCKNNGITIASIANRAEVVPSTLTQWIKGEKGITAKNEARVERAMRELAQILYENIGGIENDRHI